MKTPENRLDAHSISLGNLMALFLHWHWQAFCRLWKPWFPARMWRCLKVVGFPVFENSPDMALIDGNQKIKAILPKAADQSFAI
jgi:hypothetical protein